MTDYKLLPAAVRDLDSIWLYIAQDNIDAAEKLMDRFDDFFCTLSQQQYIGSACPELAAGMFRIPFRNYIIFYSPTDRYPLIMRIIHSARDIEKLFGHE